MPRKLSPYNKNISTGSTSKVSSQKLCQFQNIEIFWSHLFKRHYVSKETSKNQLFALNGTLKTLISSIKCTIQQITAIYFRDYIILNLKHYVFER